MSNGPKEHPSFEPYSGPSGGYGSLRSVGEILLREGIPAIGAETLLHQNQPNGFMCVSCAWAKPAHAKTFEFCENGVKATAWEITTRRVDESFFARHTLTELEGWLDYNLEEAGRLTHPMRWDKASDKYVPVSWEDAYAEIGRELRALQVDPDQTVFYTSGRASLEASYMYQLLARMYGTNNLPDSSNMCHESSSVGLQESLGLGVGTVSLEDFDHCDLILYIAHNPATSAPRILHQLQETVKRGGRIISFNPLRERGLERFTNPQDPSQMAVGAETQISQVIYQVKVGGDIAALTGMCKVLIEAAAAAKAGAPPSRPKLLDDDFIARHTHGFEGFAAHCSNATWSEIEYTSGLSRQEIEEAAFAYAKADRVIGCYGMGLTQHVSGVENVQMFVNLMLLCGNIGKEGAGICPIRGHSNVQGQRTVGITEKPEFAPLDTLKAQYGFEPPRTKGYSTVEACEAIVDGRLKAFIALGGNFTRAVPDMDRVEAAWRELPLTVSIATKLNRSHVIHGKVAYLLPCLGRIEIDEQASGPQAVSMEDSLAHFHGSRGHVTPASKNVRSELAIIAGIAKATLAFNPLVPWDEWVADYSKVRHAIENTYPAVFAGLDRDMFKPGGIARPRPPRERKWNTPTGRANFLIPKDLFAGEVGSQDRSGTFQLTTLRSNDQFNTTIYGYSDRFRGIQGTRLVVFMNEADISAIGCADGDFVDLATIAKDARERTVNNLRIVAYNIPRGCVGAYYPETNPLIPLGHHDKKAHTPAYKAVPVRITRSAQQRRLRLA